MFYKQLRKKLSNNANVGERLDAADVEFEFGRR